MDVSEMTQQQGKTSLNSIYDCIYSPLHINITHLVSAKESIIFQNHLVSVPHYDTQLLGSGLAGADIYLQLGRGHVHGEHVHPHLHLALHITLSFLLPHVQVLPVLCQACLDCKALLSPRVLGQVDSQHEGSLPSGATLLDQVAPHKLKFCPHSK